MERSRGVVQRKTGDLTAQDRLRPEAVVVHRPQDLERAEDKDPPPRFAHIVVKFMGANVDIRLELVLVVESKDIYVVTVHTRIRITPV